MTFSQRPGVYSSYTVSSIYGTAKSQKYLAVVASGDGDTSIVHVFDNYMQALNVFSDQNILAILKDAFENGVSKIYCVCVTDDYASAFELISSIQNIGIVLCDSQDINVLTSLKNSVVQSSSRLLERIALCAFDDSQDAVTAANLLNCERVCVLAPRSILGAFAGTVLTLDSLAYNLSGYVIASPVCISFTEQQVNEMLIAGVTVFEDVNGQTECIKALTSRTSSDSIPDKTFSSLNTILIIDDVMSTIRNSLKLRMKGAKSNQITRDSIASQVTVELSSKQLNGLIDKFASPRVFPDTSDPSVCTVEISFNVAHVVSQIHILAHIQI